MNNIQFKNISKSFGSTEALSGLTLTLKTGRVHALLGENGAGKTTLAKILAGELRPDHGGVSVDGVTVSKMNPKQAHALGIRMVHQHLSLVPTLTVTENFLLETLDSKPSTNLCGLKNMIVEQAQSFGLRVDPDREVWSLSLSERQWLEVFRAVFLGGDIIILDEPTALLSPAEGDRLLARLSAFAKSGKTVILITHKLREVFGFADQVTVLRRGVLQGTRATSDTSPQELTAMMVDLTAEVQGGLSGNGRNIKSCPTVPPSVLTVRDLCAVDGQGRQVLHNVSFDLAKGKILGVAGVSGNGQTQLADTVAGLVRTRYGQLTASPELVVRYIPADRMGMGASATLSVLENLSLRVYSRNPYCRSGLVQWWDIQAHAAALVREYSIKMTGLNLPAQTLSGGNIQKLVVARELSDRADIVVAHNPTSGLDIQTTSFVRNALKIAAVEGTGILLISDDLDEICELADDVLVLYRGGVAGLLSRSEASIERMGSLMVGGESEGGGNHK